MEWIVRNRITGEYLVSFGLSVKKKEFARHFITLKQAKTYISSSCADSSEWYTIETEESMTDNTDAEEET